MNEAKDDMTVLLLARDLLISSRITSAAARERVSVRLVRDPPILAEVPCAARLIVDLDLDGALAAAVEWGRRTQRPVAGFVQHVNAQRIREADQAGIRPIVPRSRLSVMLQQLLKPA